MKELSFDGLKIFENVLSPVEVFRFRNIVLATPMLWKGRDGEKDPINTLTKDIKQGELLFDHLQNKLFEVEPRFREHTLQRAGINLIMPQTNPPFFHTDGEVISCIFYLNQKISLNDGGETQFEFNDYIIGPKPTSGRLVIFDGMIPHRTTYFRNETRITVFFKYYKNLLYNLFE